MLLLAILERALERALAWTFILDTLHYSSYLATGEFCLFCCLSCSLSSSFLSQSCSLSFIFPKCNFQHWNQYMSSVMDPAHTSSSMWTCLILPCATNTHAINHEHVSLISECISLESVAEKTRAYISVKKYHDLTVRMWKILLCRRPYRFPVCKSKLSCEQQIHPIY